MNSDLALTLVVPVYAEEFTIIPFLEEVLERIQIPHKVLIIYDFDDDPTLNKIESAMATHPNVLFVKNQYGPGIINAFKTGFLMADTKYIVPIMADLSDMPETVNRMYCKIQEGYDLVVASRYVKGGGAVGGPIVKRFLSRWANLSLNFLTGIPTHDMTNAFIMYRKEVLDQIQIKSTGGFEITMEIIAKAFILGFTITEVPTINRDRASGQSKFKIMRWMVNYMYWYFYILVYSLRNRKASF